MFFKYISTKWLIFMKIDIKDPFDREKTPIGTAIWTVSIGENAVSNGFV